MSIRANVSKTAVGETALPHLHQKTGPRASLTTLWVFGIWAFLASVLVFWIELMVAKMLLPQFGGSPSVWNTALVFFQVNLLAGYAAAHFLSRLSSRSHKVVQSLLMAVPLLTLPVAVPAFLSGGTSLGPTAAVLIALVLMIGAPFFALTTSAPTLQHWFAHSGHPRAGDPYFLYALSNLGSVVGLFGYPLVLERVSDLSDQSVWLTFSYGAVVALTVLAARSIPPWNATPTKPEQSLPLARKAQWALVAFVPSLALLGVTRHLSTDVAAFPLMWTIPLAIYLGSFTVTFGERGNPWRRSGASVLRLAVVLAAFGSFISPPLWLGVTIPLAFLAALSLSAHGRIYEDRPEAGMLTEFYLWVSIGGAVGGLFGALIAPALFDFVVEYPLSIVMAGLLVTKPMFRAGRASRLLGATTLLLILLSLALSAIWSAVAITLAALVAFVLLDRVALTLILAASVVVAVMLPSPGVVASERTFFGVYRVHEAEDFKYIMSGSTLHGMEPSENGLPVAGSYYHPDGPVGDVFDALGDAPRDVGVVGLGIGSISLYAREGDRATFYEIDPRVETLARTHFETLSSARGAVEVLVGDGRVLLEEANASHDVLFVDAFTSDAVPVHLLTREAFQVYFDSLDSEGVLVVHVSNRHIDLEPVVGRIASDLGTEAKIFPYEPNDDDSRWATESVWMLIDLAESLSLSDDWVSSRVGDVLWTDSFSDVVSVIRWR